MDTTSLPTGTLTFLFTDIEGSTRLWEQHPEVMRAALARHDALLTAGIQEHGGQVVKSRGEGDSLFAVFPHPIDALAAACALQQALLAEPWPTETPLRVRIALHATPAELREGDYYGPGVNRCARCRAVAHGGQVLLSQATVELVRDQLPAGVSLRDLGLHRLKDLQQPERLYQLLHPALPADFPLLRSLEAFAHNLPAQLTNFIGREREMAEVKRLLATGPRASRGVPLLTLTGAGGCGKTRLALQVAADLVEEYADGVWLVELAALADPALVPQTVASVLGLREEPGRPILQTLADYLRARSLLLVLDNCEHLLPACAQLAETLLRGCPRLQILASSREGLGIVGEQTYRVPSLSLPDPEHLPPLEHLHEFEAVRLFTARAILNQPTFAVTAANAASVVQVCHRLDGIPLAIELAAARLKALPVEQIAARLDDRFRLLTGGSRTALPRQQTLRATMDWSYHLLSQTERVLLRRLSVFAGGWTIEAAEAVGAEDGIAASAVLDLLAALVEKSLVVYEDQEGEARYRLLETVREYSRDRLLEAEEEAVVRARHQVYFLGLAEQAEPKLRGPEQLVWMERLEREHDNLRAALAGLRERGETESGLRLAGALGMFWRPGYFTEGREQLEGFLALAGTCPPAVRAKALHYAGTLALQQSDTMIAVSRLEESLAIGREWGETERVARALVSLGSVALRQGDLAEARSRFEESLALGREWGEKHIIALSLSALGIIATWEGDYGTARTHLEESLALGRAVGEKRVIAWALMRLGNLARHQGDDERARSFFEESLALGRGFSDKQITADALFHLGEVACRQGKYEEACSLAEESREVAREVGHKEAVAFSLIVSAQIARGKGDWERARSLALESLSLERPEPREVGGSKRIIIACLELLAEVSGAQRKPERAACLFGAAAGLREATRMPVPLADRASHGRNLADARLAPDRAAFAAAWEAGRAMSLQDAVAYALAEEA